MQRVPVAPHLRQRIEVLRILMILGVVMVHIPFLDGASPFAPDADGFDWVVVFLRESLFRVGVPCLTVISGFLLATRTPGRYGDLLRKKARTILLPFLVFNLAVFAAVLALQAVGAGTYWPDIRSSGAEDLLDLAIAWSDKPINLPLYFLRELFLCILLAPVLLWLLRRVPRITLATLLGLYLLNLNIPVFLRDDMLLWFTAGLWLGRSRTDLEAMDGWVLPAALTLLLFGAAVAELHVLLGEVLGDPMAEAAKRVFKLVGLIATWILVGRVARSRLGAPLARWGRYSFWIFLVHGPILVVLAMIWNRKMAFLPAPVFYFGSPVATVAIAMAGYFLLRAVVPGLLALVTGGRTAPRDRLPRPAAPAAPEPAIGQGGAPRAL